MKLWQKDITPEKLVESFTIGDDDAIDLHLAEFDVLGSMAHAAMLQRVGLLTDGEQDALQAELKKIYLIIQAGDFVIESGVEDIHSQVELMLTRALGEVGKKIRFQIEY